MDQLQQLARTVDVHTHFVPDRLPALPAGFSEATWPSMAQADNCCHRHVMVKGSIYRTVTDQCWSAPRRIEDMQGQGVTRQVLSPMPELLSYWMAPQVAAILHNEIDLAHAAAKVARHRCEPRLPQVLLGQAFGRIAAWPHSALCLKS